MPCQVHDVRGQLLLAHLGPVGPVLAGEHGHAHQHLCVVWHALNGELLPFECFGKNIFNAHGDIAQQRAERAGRIGAGRVAYQHLESAVRAAAAMSCVKNVP